MAYEIWISRDPPFTLADWQSAVRARDDVRLRERPTTATNPKTGEVIRMETLPGDAEVLLNGEWVSCFRWSQRGSAGADSGSVAFKAPLDFNEPGCVVRAIASELAVALDARVVGDEGEEYK